MNTRWFFFLSSLGTCNFLFIEEANAMCIEYYLHVRYPVVIVTNAAGAATFRFTHAKDDAPSGVKGALQ